MRDNTRPSRLNTVPVVARRFRDLSSTATSSSSPPCCIPNVSKKSVLARVAVLLCKVTPDPFRYPPAGSLGEVDVVCVIRHVQQETPHRGRASTPARLCRRGSSWRELANTDKPGADLPAVVNRQSLREDLRPNTTDPPTHTIVLLR